MKIVIKLGDHGSIHTIKTTMSMKGIHRLVSSVLFKVTLATLYITLTRCNYPGKVQKTETCIYMLGKPNPGGLIGGATKE